jgi:hypothetical protein
MPRLCLSLLLSLWIASSASAVTMDWTFIGNPGNPADTQVMTCCGDSTGTAGYGSVPYAYSIGTYEVANAQYSEFLNAVAQSDPNSLYHSQMSSADLYGGITRSGSSGSFTYSVNRRARRHASSLRVLCRRPTLRKLDEQWAAHWPGGT